MYKWFSDFFQGMVFFLSGQSIKTTIKRWFLTIQGFKKNEGFLSPFRDAPEYLLLNGKKRKKFSPHSMINTQEEADCGAAFFGSFLFCKRNERLANNPDLFILP